MSGGILQGKRVLITQADAFMGPVLCQVFAEQGASVMANTQPLIDPRTPSAVVTAVGLMDVLVVNLAVPAPSTPVTEVTDTEWRDTFASLVDPLPRLFRAVLPQMIERRAGKILVMGSASALRGMRRTSTYSAARGAQLAYVQSVGVADSPGEKEQCAGGGLQAGAAVEFRRQHGCGNSIGYRVGVWRLDERRGWVVA